MDALVKSAIAHWAPRFVANGVALTDFEEVTATDAVVTITAMLKAVNVQLFELGMWQAWSGR